MAGCTSIICLGRETFETMRMKRQEVDQALLFAEDYVEKQGVPQIDFTMMNENGIRDQKKADEQKKKDSLNDRSASSFEDDSRTESQAINKEPQRQKSREMLNKFRRAIRRLVLLSRAAKKRGNPDFNIGGLIYEVTENADKYENN